MKTFQRFYCRSILSWEPPGGWFYDWLKKPMEPTTTASSTTPIVQTSLKFFIFKIHNVSKRRLIQENDIIIIPLAHCSV